MSNLKEIKIRISSIKSTQKMTKAMRMVAASKLRRAKEKVESARPYSHKIQELLLPLTEDVKSIDKNNVAYILFNGNEKKTGTHLVVVVSSDKGLCGGINSSVVKFVSHHIDSLKKKEEEVKIICLGKKGYEQLKGRFDSIIIDKQLDFFKNGVSLDSAKEFTDSIIDIFNVGEVDTVSIVYNKFISAMVQEANIKQIMPFCNKKCINDEHVGSFEYEPDKGQILEQLIIKNIYAQFFNLLLENYASEQGARMSAMENATNNAGDMIKNLTLIYNRTRQANITGELMDIVSGAEAV